MARLLTFFLVMMTVSASAQTADRPLSRAMDAMRAGNWAEARIAARGDGSIAQDLIEWHYLRAGRGTYQQTQAFLARNPDWPGLPYLREKSEASFVEASHAEVRDFFAMRTPRTGTGALSLARAQAFVGDDGLAMAGIVLAWRTLPLAAAEHAAFLQDHAGLVGPHHVARLDTMLWKGWDKNARAMLPLVDDTQQKLAAARLALRDATPNVDGLIAAVPDALQSHPGLAHDRFKWRLKKQRTAGAIELLLARSVSADALGEPWAWARDRRVLARDRMRQGDAAQAYDIASSHFLVEGSDYADLEWLSGYLALRFLDKPHLARTHFQAFQQAVETPISKARAGYWLGRAHEAAGDEAAAALSYAYAARYQTAFYGLMAADRAKLPPDWRLSGAEKFPPWREAAFTRSSTYKAAVLLMAAGEMSLAERFFTHLSEKLDRVQIGQMGMMLAEVNQPHIQVMLGKRAAQKGHQVMAPYFALHPLSRVAHPVPTEMVLAIARRESEFDPKVVSGAGAQGLMQVMPRTAKEVAGWLDIDFSKDRLTSDWPYNARIGARYLAELAARYDGNPILMSAAYNAGPSRADRWIDLMGDPRSGTIDVVDWIEFIPFRETRNYVMRVTESLPVYRARLGQPPHPVPFSQELAGSTLLPRAPEGE
ncbi:MAG: lytic transglycosylase domain-containing protein [Rhodobacteraceae bacterium]|nr:lytic transglycosylase domain-containing protein [Paracoccaceae bacterium]